MKTTGLNWTGVEFAVLHFHFEFSASTNLTPAGLLQLRRELRSTARDLFAFEASEGAARGLFQSLFDPPLPPDPVALRRYQRPGPPFVLAIDPAAAGSYEAGDHWTLKVLLWGQGGALAADLARVLQAQARAGFGPGLEPGELVAIEVEDASGARQPLWREGQPLWHLTPVFCELDWWLSNQPLAEAWRLEFLTPARLVSGNKPLFRGDLAKVFPFVLRRVSSMCYAHCGRDLMAEPGPLLEAAAEVQVGGNTLAWSDWRSLDRGHEVVELGGLMGGLTLTGSALEKILPLLQVGQLLNLGKGAGFGAGAYQLVPDVVPGA